MAQQLVNFRKTRSTGNLQAKNQTQQLECITTRNKTYTLNREKALEKKQNRCSREHV